MADDIGEALMGALIVGLAVAGAVWLIAVIVVFIFVKIWFITYPLIAVTIAGAIWWSTRGRVRVEFHRARLRNKAALVKNEWKTRF
jgi:hypothetical protein